MCAGIVGCNHFSLYSPLSEARTNHDTVLTGQLVSHVSFGYRFGIDEANIDLMVVVGASVGQTFADTLLSVL